MEHEEDIEVIIDVFADDNLLIVVSSNGVRILDIKTAKRNVL